MPVILATWNVEIEITVQSQLEKNITKTPSEQNKLDMMVHAYNPSYMRDIRH
jgi:hypothetical protein